MKLELGVRNILGQHKIISRLFYESFILAFLETTVLHGTFAGLEHHVLERE